MLIFKRIAGAIALMFLHASLASANTGARDQVMVINRDNGGSVVEYAQRVERVRNRNVLVAFNGPCASACTLFLSLSPSQTCIAPGASFHFHRPFGARADMNQWGADYLEKRYPVWVRQWISRNGGLSSQLIRMDYAYAAQYMRRCQTA